MGQEIIHDDDGMNTTMFLALSWGLPGVCQAVGCDEPTAAIVCFDAERSPTGHPYKLCICEEHYQKGVRDGRLVDSFDI